MPGTDSDPDPGTDIRPKTEYSSDRGSGSRSESKSKSVQWELFSVQYNVAIRFMVPIRVGI